MNYRILSKFYQRCDLLWNASNYIWSHEWLNVALVESIEGECGCLFWIIEWWNEILDVARVESIEGECGYLFWIIVWWNEILDVARIESIEGIVSEDNDVLNYRIMNESFRHPMLLRKKMKVWMIDFYANPCDFMDCCHPFWIIVYWNQISGVARVKSIERIFVNIVHFS